MIILKKAYETPYALAYKMLLFLSFIITKFAIIKSNNIIWILLNQNLQFCMSVKHRQHVQVLILSF